MKKIFLVAFLFVIFVFVADAQTIRVNPTGVNVNSQNPTTVFLTFGQIPAGYVPAEAVWCGELVPAIAPAIGQQCNPNTIYGVLPARYNQSTSSGNSGFTDIMGIPASVVRRAYQVALDRANAGFFYVRHFVSINGQPDQYVIVTCRMTGGGARVPFALTNVEIKTPTKEPVLFVKTGERFPEISVDIQYNGTGRLKGRWEIVQPGEEPPGERDLLTEATLPVEDRGVQKRYTQISRFNYFLPPNGKFQLKLENSNNLPILAEGQYLLLLRIEATDDKESDSNLAAVGVGNGVVHSGAVASFPMPTLKFFVIGGNSINVWEQTALVNPPINTMLNINQAPVFSWKGMPEANAYRLEVLNENGAVVLSAITTAPLTSYRAPSWFWRQLGTKNLAWRVAALNANGGVINQTLSQKLTTRE